MLNVTARVCQAQRVVF